MTESNKTVTAEEKIINSEKTPAILAYITLFGWVAAIVITSTSEKKNDLATLHIRQSLGLMLNILLFIVLQIVFLFIPFIGRGLSFVLILGYLAIIALWIIGLGYAIAGQQKPLPFVGKIYNKYLKFIN